MLFNKYNRNITNINYNTKRRKLNGERIPTHNNCPSKDTFALLGYIYAVQAGEVKANAPVLTLPVTRP